MAKDKSFVKTIGGKNNTTDLTGVGQEVMKKLLGKTVENPMSTIAEGKNASVYTSKIKSIS